MEKELQLKADEQIKAYSKKIDFYTSGFYAGTADISGL